VIAYDKHTIFHKCLSGARIHRRTFKTRKMNYTIKWKRITVFSLSCLLLIISWNAIGQDSDPIIIPNDYSEMGKIRKVDEGNKDLKQELDKYDLNRITLQQMGNLNNAFIRQFSDNDPNLAIVHQKGNDNSLDLTQKGSSNASDIKQDGFNNLYSGYHFGDDIIINVIQKGKGNSILQELEGDNMDFQIEQKGNYNGVTQLYGDTPSAGYKVIQKGDNMSIIIKQDQIFRK
jgi:hypothetical protein